MTAFLAIVALSTVICFFVWWDAIGELDGLAPGWHLGRKDFHHWYVGLVLQIFLIWGPAWWAILLVLLGQWMMWDDAHQHLVHVRQVLKGFAPKYHSLWHNIYAATIYKWFGSKVDFNA